MSLIQLNETAVEIIYIVWDVLKVILLPLVTIAGFLSLLLPGIYRKKRFVRLSNLDLRDETVQSAFVFSTLLPPTAICFFLIFFLTSSQPTALSKLLSDDRTAQHVYHAGVGLIYVTVIFAKKCWAGRIEFELFWTFLLVRCVALIIRELNALFFTDETYSRPLLNIGCLCILSAISAEALVLFGAFVKGETSGKQYRELIEPLLSPDRLEAATPPPKPFRQGREIECGLIDYLTFSFATPVIKHGYSGELTREAFPSLGEDEDPEATYKLFKLHWRYYSQRRSENALFLSLWGFAASRFVTTGCFELLHSVLEACIPVVLKGLLDSLVKARGDLNYQLDAFVYVVLLVVANISSQIMVSQFLHHNVRFSTRIRSVLQSAIFDKSLCLNSIEASRGQIVNMTSVDANQADWASSSLHNCWSAPLQVLLQLFVLYHQIGWPAFVCVFVMAGSTPIAKYIFQIQSRIQERILAKKDIRTKVTSEILAGLKAVKMYAWENIMHAKASQMRSDELKELWKHQLCSVGSAILWDGTPVLMLLIVFGLCAFLPTSLDTPTLMTAFAILGKVAFPLTYLPLCVSSVSEGRAVLKRLQVYLQLPEVRPRGQIPLSDPAVKARNACVSWPKSKPAVEEVAVALPLTPWESGNSDELLRNVTFTVPIGSHMAITGRTGAGKSTLMSALIGDLVPTKGLVETSGSIAYVAQEAWLQSGTVMSNILFGEIFDRARYNMIIDATELRPDLDTLPQSDLTTVGEKGVTLSGGQKQRICLARALYRNADVLILDDIFSALDSHTAEAIAEKTLRSMMLRDKTVILATHRFEVLKHFHQVFTITNKGEVQPFDTASALELDIVPVQSTVTTRSTRAQTFADMRDLSPVRIGAIEFDSHQLIALSTDEAEKVELGAVDWAVYRTWVDAAGGYVMVISLLSTYCATRALQICGAFWFAEWANNWNNPEAMDRRAGYGILAGLWLGEIVCIALESSLMALCSQRSGAKFHDKLLTRFLHAKLSFITTTPMGRMLNRLSKDLSAIDQELPFVMSQSVTMFFEVTGMLTAAVIALPASILALPPVLFMYWRVQQIYVATSRQVARLESAAFGPVLSLVSEAVDGSSTIRAFGKQAFIKADFFKRLSTNLVYSYFCETATRWVEIRLLGLSMILSTSVALLCVVCVTQVSVGLAGLVIAYSFSVPGALNWLVKVNSDRESSMVSVERIQGYFNDNRCPQEYTPEPVLDPISDWPTEGHVEIKNLSLRYRVGQAPALKRVSFEILPGEKVGIVGRTGAGKSSLMAALLRLVEPEPGSEIFIDNVPTDRVDLCRLRSAVGVIPQDPTLFTGTLRYNLDPSGKIDDVQLWQTLEHSCLATFVNSLSGGLDAVVEEGGSNFSIGQRQLICLARVLLRKNRILLLDEATSSVDSVTDSILQSTLKREFKSCTVITIAHRLNTVADHDKIAVMSNGSLVEYGTPQELLAIKGGHYHTMMATL